MNRLLFSFLFVTIQIASTYSQSKITTLQVPGTGQYCQIDPVGASVLPSGRYVTPAGKVSAINRAPYGLAVSPDQQIALVLHNEVVTVVDLRNNEPIRIPSYDGKIPPVVEGSSFMGIAFEPGSHRAWLSGGDKGTVVLFDADKKQKLKAISIDGLFGDKQYEDSYISDIAFDGSRNQLLALDRANNRLVKIDLQTEKITASIKVGRIPFGISLSPDGSKAFVANVGLFEYPLVPGVTPQNKDSLMLE
ncbi:MAG: hypothetical protein JNK77_07055, partial [Saprospiraceae bacterium]|nr:hypothetical protein [Saprospiraceae bacterium]